MWERVEVNYRVVPQYSAQYDTQEQTKVAMRK